MILSKEVLKYFRSLQSKVHQAMMTGQVKTPYFIDGDKVLENYEVIRDVWFSRKPIKEICHSHGLARSTYYELENNFISHGLPGLLPIPNHTNQFPELEKLIIMVKKCRPTLTNTALFRIAQAIPLTSSVTMQIITDILNSYGLYSSRLKGDEQFFSRIQRTLVECTRLKEKFSGSRSNQRRKETFFDDEDYPHKRLELLRELFYNPKAKAKDLCVQYGVSQASYYRLVDDYKLYGPWAIIPAPSHGKKNSISGETELRIILHKLKYPRQSGNHIVDVLKLKCSRHVVDRILNHWGLMADDLKPTALDEYIVEEKDLGIEAFAPQKSAYHCISEETLLETRRINRNFNLICRKMKTHTYHICDPGPILLAPFVNNLGIVQSFETYGPTRLRGKEVTNLALLNVMRILGGYQRINHLNDNRDHSVALASGLGLFGSCSKFYENTINFKFKHLHKLRCDLVTRASELNIIDGKKIGFDFHFKEFYGQGADEKQIGHGPDKSGQLVPGFRPHIAWDLAENVIITMAYYQGATRSPRIIKEFCERDIFPILDRLMVEEIYVDSEYTKEADIHYFKELACKNGDIYICLRQNKQIKKLIKPALEDHTGWEKHDDTDERKTIDTMLPKSKLNIKIVILRNAQTKENTRCFGSTNLEESGEDITRKYRYRWLIENGIKDLITSYFADEIFGHDPEKVEFEFYCIMVARLAYEHFLRELGGDYFHKKDGNKYTLSTMRQQLFEKRNCTISQDSDENFVLTFLDCGNEKLEQSLIEMYDRLSEEGTNKVLWWNNRGLKIEFKNQSDLTNVSG